MLNNATKNTIDTDTYTGNNGGGGGGTSKDSQALLAELSAQVAELQRKLELAKGTETDIQPPVPRKQDLGVRIEQVLRTHICTTKELAKLVDEPEAKVSEKLKSIRKNLADVGTPDEARWVWRIGDSTSAKELQAMVARLIEGRAMTTAELARITGARMPRVNGVLVELQRDPSVPIFNLGSDFRAKWLILPKTAKPANLPPKVVRKK